MAEESQVTVGADIGNATSIVAVAVGGKVSMVKMPTAKAVAGMRLPETLAKDEPVITRDRDGVAIPVALGMAALRYADEPSPARGHEDRYGAWTLDFVLGSIAQAVRASRVSVKLAVTVPAELHRTIADSVATAMRGTHTLTFQGRTQSQVIRSVRVVREGEAAFAALPKRDGKGILIDGGGGTTHVALWRNGALIDVVTRNIGVQRALDTADRAIAEQIGRRLSLLERMELERALVARAPYAVTTGRQQVRVDHIARAYLSATADTLINDIKSIVPAWRTVQYLDLCGGVAFLLPDAFAAAFPGIVAAQRPDELNARGALALAGIAETEARDVAV